MISLTDTAAAAFNLTIDARHGDWTRVGDGENLYWVRRGATRAVVSYAWGDKGSYEAAYSEWCRTYCAPDAVCDELDAAL